ncbi:hypothetical protein MJO29_003132 [Puccinia striiformis f. sp. tritici]|nr:hypothetical protein MJO29_003132 [Puccinia striiformis f. sp. tritici]
MCTKRSLDDAELEIPNDRHPCKLRRLAFMVSQLSSSLAAVYSSDKKKQKDWIRIDLEACELLSRQSAMWYHHFTIGKYGMATTVYQEFLSRRSEWRTSIEGGGKTLQELWNTKSSISIKSAGITHSSLNLRISLPFNSYNLGENLKELLVELHLNLAKGYTSLGQHADALSTLEQVWNPTRKVAFTWSHKYSKKLANIYCSLEKN